MRKSERDKRNYIIIGLCAVVAIMAIGFAAFSQQLKINSTSEVTSTWCVGFDTTKTSDYVATAGLNGGTLPTASMSYNGNTCGSDSLQTGANLSASFAQPGDEVVYTFTIKNSSSLNAKLDSIDESITTSNSAIDYELSGAKAGDVLGPNDTTTLVVTVSYKSSITGQPDSTSWGLSIKLNFSQTSESAGGSGGESSSNQDGYYVFDTSGHSIGDDYDVSGLTLNEIPSGRNVFLKYVVSGGKITEAYVCTKFSFINDPVCMRGGKENGENPSNFYTTETTGNKAIIESLSSTFSSNSGSCSADSSNSDCHAGDFNVNADSTGNVNAIDYSSGGVYCDVFNNGGAYCYEY